MSSFDEEKAHQSEQAGEKPNIVGAGVVQKLHIEARGIERVSPTERHHTRAFDNFTMWLSANMCISTFALGTLGISLFNLGFWDSFLTILFFNILAILPPSFFATLGPKLGLRQMTITRFSFGWVGAIIMSIFNVLACVGWSAVNVIVGGQLINALSNNTVPLWAGVVIISVLTTAISIFGYQYVHTYERFAWIPIFIIFLILLGEGAHNFSMPAWGTGSVEAGGVLSFGCAIYGFGTGWTSYAADYNVHQPEDVPPIRVFLWTFFGLFIPLFLVELLGMAFTTTFVNAPQYASAYGEGSVGGLLGAIVAPLGGFGKFLLVLLALSVIANNVPNDYSLGLSIQVFGSIFLRVPRYVWTFVGAVIYIIIALVGSTNFSSTLDNFLLIIAYWLGPYAMIVTIEHFAFRRGEYNVEDWNTPSKLPLGWAAITALCFGIAGAVVGMDTVYFVGPLAVLIGGDIGFELASILAAIVYLILRPIEKRIHGR